MGSPLVPAQSWTGGCICRRHNDSIWQIKCECSRKGKELYSHLDIGTLVEGTGHGLLDGLHQWPLTISARSAFGCRAQGLSIDRPGLPNRLPM